MIIITLILHIFYLGIPSESTNSSANQNGISTSSTNQNGDSRLIKFPVVDPVVLDNPLNVDGIMKKLQEFNKDQGC